MLSKLLADSGCTGESKVVLQHQYGRSLVFDGRGECVGIVLA